MSESVTSSRPVWSRASGAVRAPRTIRRTRRWLNANGDRAIASVLIVPAIALLPVEEGRWLVVLLSTLTAALAVLLHRAVKAGRASPWVSLFGAIGISGATLLGPKLTFASLVLLTAYVAHVARTYGRWRAVGNIALGAAVLGAAGTLGDSVNASALLLWLFAAVSTVGIIGDSGELLTSVAAGVGLDLWDGAADGAARRTNIHPRDRHLLDYHEDQVAAGHDHELRYRVVEPTGERWILELVRVAGNRVQGATIDITERMEAEERLALYADLVESIGLGLVLVEQTSVGVLEVRAANPAVTNILGTSDPELLARTFAAELQQVVEEGVTIELGPTRLPGEPSRFVRLRAFPLGGYMAALTVEDATAWQLANAALEAQAGNDSVTGLANRNGLRRELNELFLRDGTVAVAMFHADLDNFRDVNESLGHANGDRLLAALARRLTVGLPDARVIARVGGDDFSIVFEGEANTNRAGDLAEEIRELIAQDVEIDGMRLSVTAAIGIATSPHDATDAADLVTCAERAMYSAKRSAMRVAYHDADDVAAANRLALIADLPGALATSQFTNHYQPVIDLPTGTVVGAETLVRWCHPERGLLLPTEFVTIAELAGYGAALARTVAARAVADGAAWRAAGLDLFVTLNMSASTLSDPTMATTIGQLLREHRLPPDRLRLEITEAAVVDDLYTAVNTLAALRASGSEVSIDDFGIGYSSLSLLKRLPLDEIKLDRVVLADLESRDASLVRAVIDLAHGLGLRVVAEGVERIDVLDQLVDLGCDRAQGYLFGRPTACDEFVELVHRAPPALAEHLSRLMARSHNGGERFATVTPITSRKLRRKAE